MRKITIAATQMACTQETQTNISRAEENIRAAAAQGAQIVLLQELFSGPYFCQDEDKRFLSLAREAQGHPMLEQMAALAKELGVVLPVSFFEKANQVCFNSVMVIDADGTFLGIYRKTHIPDDPGYSEKFYFSPGDTGFKVWSTRYGRIGVGICWDQWYPEAARVMALRGAEILFYPTAIGSDPPDQATDHARHWQRVMQGHAAANLMPVCASNRVGTEKGQRFHIDFYGSSFIAGPDGAIITEADREEEKVLSATFDLDDLAVNRAAFPLFRDRRPEHYGALLTLDGR